MTISPTHWTSSRARVATFIGVVDPEGRLVGALSLRTVTDVLAREALRGEYVGVSGFAGARGHESLRLTGGVRVRALAVPPALFGSTVRKLDVRSRWHVSVLALRSGGVDAEVDPDRALGPGDTLVVMGDERDLDRFADSLRRGTVRAV
ncbi:MAG TPA: hypothetical protein DEP35_06120 [Deltaproteobacteria bacterium]|nr:hypothetical protein [Deltaproteobacteria bacterium]